MKDEEKFSILKVEVTLAGQFSVTVKVLEPPAMPIRVSKGRVTLAVPVVGSVTIAFVGQ